MNLSVVLRIIVSVILVTSVLYKFNFSDIIEYLKKITFYQWTFLFGIQAFAIVLNSYKWRVFLELQVSRLVNYNFIGQFFNIFLPGPLFGEVAKGLLLKTKSIPMGTVFASIYIDKLIGFIGLFVIGIVGLSYRSFVENSFQDLLWLLLILSCLIFLYFSILILPNGLSKVIDEKFVKGNEVKGKILFNLKNFVDTWRELLKQPIKLVLSIPLAVIYQFFGAIILYFTFDFTGVAVDFSQCLFIYLVLSLVLFLPISIAGVGVREVSLVQLTIAQGFSEEKAIAVSWILLILQMWVGVLGGILYLIDKKK